jgi:sucrose-6-phosphate hydrolase SacC (GH32 family)
MKTMKLLTLTILSTFVLSSCTSNENLPSEVSKTKSLKSYKVKRDVSGAYAIEYDLEKNTASEKVINYKTKTNEFHFYESDFTANKKVSEELFMDTKKLSINFIDANSNDKSNITIEDDLRTSAKNIDKNTMLSEYSVAKTGIGSYTLDFKVKDKVSVDFVYNEILRIYEIHLEKGKSNGTNFSRNFEKMNNEILRIDFVNHIKTYSAKGEEAEGIVVSRRKPRVIIITELDE